MRIKALTVLVKCLRMISIISNSKVCHFVNVCAMRLEISLNLESLYCQVISFMAVINLEMKLRALILTKDVFDKDKTYL